MRSPELEPPVQPTPETIDEQLSPLEKLRDFNVAEKSKNLKELAVQGIDSVKSFFEHIKIKGALNSFFGEKTTLT